MAIETILAALFAAIEWKFLMPRENLILPMES
jgi:hypothetical protein